MTYPAFGQAARGLFTLLLCTATLTLAGCDLFGNDDHDHDHDHGDEHAEAHGVRLLVDGVNVYTILEGTVTCDAAPCGLDVAAGASETVELVFLEEDGSPLTAADFDEAFSTEVVVKDAAVAEAASSNFRFTLTGQAAGATVLQVRLLHNGHADFTSPPFDETRAIAVQVTQ